MVAIDEVNGNNVVAELVSFLWIEIVKMDPHLNLWQDDEWEDVEDGEDGHADFMQSLNTSSNGRLAIKDIEAMKNILNDEVHIDFQVFFILRRNRI